MTIADSLFADMGGLRLPVTASQVGPTDTTAVLDPGQQILLELFAAAINSELGPVWADVVSSLPASREGLPHYLVGSTPVMDTVALPPNADTMGQRAAGWPLLAIHRTVGAWDEYTLSNDRLTQTWELHYIMGPVDASEEHKLGHVCTAVHKVVGLTIREGGHRSYRGGALQFFGDRAAFSRIILKDIQGTGPAAFAGSSDKSPLYYATTMTLETWEVASENQDGYGECTGATFEAGVGGSDGILPSVLLLDTEDATSTGGEA